jgi:hypothetical protein
MTMTIGAFLILIAVVPAQGDSKVTRVAITPVPFETIGECAQRMDGLADAVILHLAEDPVAKAIGLRIDSASCRAVR